jgi:hypothetical protein
VRDQPLTPRHTRNDPVPVPLPAFLAYLDLPDGHTHSPNIFTTLSAEDPQTSGERSFFDEGGGFAAAVRSLHYAPSLAKLRQPALSAALSTGTTISGELGFQIVLWESFLATLKGLRFVGGFFPADPAGVLPYAIHNGKFIVSPSDPLRLDQSSGTFIGIEEKTFRRLVDTARNGPILINDLPRLKRRPTGFSGASYLRAFPPGRCRHCLRHWRNGPANLKITPTQSSPAALT